MTRRGVPDLAKLRITHRTNSLTCNSLVNATAMQSSLEDDISDSEYRTIHRKCAADWTDDYQMRAYCEKLQFVGIRELRK